MTYLAAHLRAASWWLLPLAVLLVVIGWETGWGSAFERRLAPAEPIAPKAVVAALLPEYAIVGGAAGHTEMVNRTLFNPTRRPAPAAADVGVAKLQRGQFALTGTLVVDGKSTAFLREVAGNKSRRVLAGEKINGMLVAEVKSDRIKLTLGDEFEELTLKVAANPRPTEAAAPLAAPATAAALPPPPTPPVARVVGPAGTPEAAQTLAERRRAARAAAADAAANPPVAATPPAAAAQAVDPRWEQMDQRYRERSAAGGNRGAAQ